MSCKIASASDDGKLGKDSAISDDLPSAKKPRIDEEPEAGEDEYVEPSAEIEDGSEEIVGDDSKNAQHEESLGIIERVNKTNKRFGGTLKQITSDFIVNEIDLDNHVVYLNDLSEPRAPTEEDSGEKLSAQFDKGPSRDEHEQSMKKILGDIKYQELIDFLNTNSTSSSFRIEAPSE